MSHTRSRERPYERTEDNLPGVPMAGYASGDPICTDFMGPWTICALGDPRLRSGPLSPGGESMLLALPHAVWPTCRAPRHGRHGNPYHGQCAGRRNGPAGCLGGGGLYEDPLAGCQHRIEHRVRIEWGRDLPQRRRLRGPDHRRRAGRVCDRPVRHSPLRQLRRDRPGQRLFHSPRAPACRGHHLEWARQHEQHSTGRQRCHRDRDRGSTVQLLRTRPFQLDHRVQPHPRLRRPLRGAGLG